MLPLAAQSAAVLSAGLSAFCRRRFQSGFVDSPSRIELLASPRLFEVELADGQRYFGALGGTVRRRLLVGVGAGAIDLSMDDVIRITPLEAGFWHRIDGSIEFGKM